VTPLDKEIRRELVIDGQPYTVTVTPTGVRIVPKGKRTGAEVSWRDLLSGDAQLASQLNRSLQGGDSTKQ